MADYQKRNVNRGQTLLFVFMLLLLLTFLAGSVAVMWESGLQSNALHKDSVSAFYLAQAGIDRAMDEIAYHDGNESSSYNDTWNNGNYVVNIVTTGGGDKRITSTGQSGTAERIIYIELPKNTGKSCKTPSDCPPYGNAWGYYRKIGNSWTEQ